MSATTCLRPDPNIGFSQVVGIGGIGTGKLIALEGDHTLGREESRLGAMLNARDYCKLHIVEHYIAKLMGTGNSGEPFQVIAVGNVGDDGTGPALVAEMSAAGINTDNVRVLPDFPTLFSVCFLYPDRTGGNITTSNSAASALDSQQVEGCRALLEAAGPRGVALCLPEVPLEARATFLRIATECTNYRVASFAAGDLKAAADLGLLAQLDLLSLNWEEATAITGENLDDSRVLDTLVSVLEAAERGMRIIVTAGAHGTYAFEDGMWSRHAAIRVESVSTAGAGDALLGGVIAALSAGLPFRVIGSAAASKEIVSAIDVGRLLAAFSVTSPHTIHPGADLAALLDFAARQNLTISERLQHARNNPGPRTPSPAA